MRPAGVFSVGCDTAVAGKLLPSGRITVTCTCLWPHPCSLQSSDALKSGANEYLNAGFGDAEPVLDRQ